MNDIDDNHMCLRMHGSATVTVTDDHPVHYHYPFSNDSEIAADTGLKLSLKNAQFKILIFNDLSRMHQQFNAHMFANMITVQLINIDYEP